MDVQPQGPLEQALRDQRTVRGDDHRLHVAQLDRLVELLRLANLDAQPLGDLFRGRGADLPATALRPVGSREQERDVVAARQALQHVGAERRRGGNADLHVR